MSTARWILVMVLLTLIPFASAPAQQIGDEVRVRTSEDAPWEEGQLMDFHPDSTLVLRPGVAERAESYVVEELERADHYSPNSPVWPMMGGVVGGMASQLIFPCEEETAFQTGNCLTGSRGGDLALWGGVGLVAGGIGYLLNPGDWETWIENGRLQD